MSTELNVYNIATEEKHETEIHEAKRKCHLYDYEREIYCPKCHGLLEMDDVNECKWCNGWTKEVDLVATLAMNEYNPLGQVKVWRWTKS